MKKVSLDAFSVAAAVVIGWLWRVAALATCVSGWSIRAQPVNDSFVNQVGLSGFSISVTGSNVNATKEPGEPDHSNTSGGKSVWWSWTSPSDGVVKIAAEGSGFQAMLAVYAGASVSSLTEVAGNRPAGSNRTSQITFNAVSNTTYVIAVDGADGTSGNVILRFDLDPERALIANEPRADFWVTDGTVYAIVETNGVVYLGGDFNYVMPNRGQGRSAGFLIDLESHKPDLTFPGLYLGGDGFLPPVTSDGKGGWFIGSGYAGLSLAPPWNSPSTNMVHILADKTVNTNWNPRFSADFPGSSHFPYLYSIVVASDTVYVSGFFTTVNGVARNGLVALDRLSGEVLPWYPSPTQFPQFLTLAEDALYVSGQSGARAYDLRTGNLKPWNPAISGYLHVWAATCEFVYATVRNNLVALDAETGELMWSVEVGEFDTDFLDSTDIRTLAVGQGRVYFGGHFEFHEESMCPAMAAAVDARTGEFLPWNPPIQRLDQRDPARISALVLDNDVVYLGAENMGTIDTREPVGFAALDPVTGLIKDWNLATTSGTSAIGVSDKALLVLGVPIVDGKLRRNLAAFDAETGIPIEWNPNPDAPVRGLAVVGSTVYAGGDYSYDRGRYYLAALDAATSGTLPWNPAVRVAITSLAMDANAIYVGGVTYDGLTDHIIEAFSTSTDERLWTSPLDLGGYYDYPRLPRIVVHSNTVFAAFGSGAAQPFVALNTATGIPLPWTPNPLGNYFDANGYFWSHDVVASGGTLFVSGQFTNICGQPRFGLAALDPLTATARPWNPLGMPGRLSVCGKNVYGVYGRTNAPGAWDAETGEHQDWRPGAPNDGVLPGYDAKGGIGCITATPKAVYLGGSFRGFDGRSYPSLAVFPRMGAPVVLEQPAAQTLLAGTTLALTTSTLGQPPLFYQWCLNGTNLPGAINASLVISNAQPPDSGLYMLIVSNGLGQVRSAEARVAVFVPPQILNQPVGQVVSPDANVTFSVIATGSPPPRYQWRLNGVNIQDATGPTLAITNAQPTNGGSYSVVIVNLGGTAVSDTAVLLITSSDLPFADDFADPGSITGSTGVGSGNNVGTTRELGETNHVGKLGGSSVWLKWMAPANGIATFNTRGSSFDTLLAIYTGTNVANLTPVAADEDRGGFLTSRASFNAVAGGEYLIAVDGFAGATGNIVLSWSLDTTTVPFPRIITQPLSLSVFTGQTALFSVGVSSVTPVTYQWFRGCRPIAGATNATLTLTNVQRADVGAYRVVVLNASSRLAESFEAFLEIGPEPKIVSQDKVEDLFPELLGPSGLFSLASIPNGFLSVSLGSIDSQLLDNSGATTSPAEPIHCGVLGGSSKWLRLRPLVNATFLVDTMGSRIRTVLAVYRETNLLNLAAGYVTCDLSSAPDGHSLVRFNATANTDYLVAVDGMNGAQGLISLNWKLGLAPGVLPPANGTPTVRNGESTVLQVTVTNIFGATYQWRWKGQNIFGATNNTLSIPLVSRDNAGQYSIVASNFAGMTTNFLNLLVELPYLRTWPMLMNGNYRLLLPDTDAPPFILQTSSDLTHWSSLYTIGPSNTVPHLDLPATNSLPRYFRAQPWP